MTAAFENLRAAAPPPRAIFAGGSMEMFTPIEDRLGLRLPTDYKQLCCTYGVGDWLRFLDHVNPLAYATFEEYLADITVQLDAERSMREKFPEYVPFALYPEVGGLFFWGITENGDQLYWLTQGEPDIWPIIIRPTRSPRYCRFDLRTCEFLLEWISGRLRVWAFPNDFDYGVNAPFHQFGVLEEGAPPSHDT
jgi:hypothetical protein